MKKQLLLTIATLTTLCTSAQTSSDFMVPLKQANTTIEFDVNATGEEYKVNWGMDAAWDWDMNVNRGIAYIGKGNFATGRVSFQPVDLVIDNGDGTYTLTECQQKKLKWRCDLMKLTGTKDVNINCDHEALFYKVDANGNYPEENGDKILDYTGRTNYLGKPQEWYKLIKASVAYVKAQGLNVVSISPFNEPDLLDWQQSTTERNGKEYFKSIAQLIKADSYFDGIRVCGGNTLNDDKALAWYNYLKEYLDEGNTHQLAGSFTNYADFFTQVRADGKVATADEMHNVGDAIVGVNYGMQNGIWWGFDSRARGQFCLDSNEGVRIGYGENRNAWMSGAVYRNNKTYEFNDKKGHEVHGYIGSSERQAVASSFAFASTTQDVYFNGYGPTRMYVFDMPGGKSGDYQSAAQINAERIIDITWGEDVASGMIDGTYVIVNKNNGRALYRNSTTGDRGLYWVSTIAVSPSTGTTNTTMQWNVNPHYTAGDISYWFIDNVTDHEQRNLNVLDNNLGDGARLIAFNAKHDINEQWYLRYVQDGYYYIINRLTNKYLCCPNSSTTELVLNTGPAYNSRSNEAFLWRFQPIDAGNDQSAPRRVSVAPTAKLRAGSIELAWEKPNRETNELTYIVVRAEVAANGTVGDYNTIGRNIPGTTFIDNTALPSKTYSYKVRSVDYAGNRSTTFSPALNAVTLSDPALICQLQFENNLLDNTANHLNAASHGNESYSTANYKSGEKSFYFNGSTHLMLPYSAGQRDELTIATWVYWSGGNDWQRIFDFGNNQQQYMFLSPCGDNEMRFVLKNGGAEEILATTKLSTGSWRHIAVTLKPTGDKMSATLYLNGTAVAQRDDLTIRPSDIAPSFCYIGRSMYSSDPMFKGNLDDFRVYNYALSADEVAAITTDLDVLSKDLDDSYEEVTTGIQAPRPPLHPTQGSLHDLGGRTVSATATGVLIQDGKKYYKK